MNNIKQTSHWSFWLIAFMALIWNLLGVANFLGQLNTETIASMPESHRALIENRPVWGTIAFGIAVFGGVIGCLLLLLRNRLAVSVFFFSLAGVIIQLIPSLMVMNSGTYFSAGEIVLAFVLPVVVAVFLVLYARKKLIS